MRNFIRSITPSFLLKAYRSGKKRTVRKAMDEQVKNGVFATLDSLKNDLKACGIQSGDAVLVHASLSKLGYVDGGPKTVVDALMQVLGEDGHILMPSSPNAGLQLEYIQQTQVFDVAESPSKMGALSEYFRKLPNVKRSESPTEPVCAWGKKAEWIVSGHAHQLTPYTAQSPFARLVELKGKILYIGVTLDNAGTSLHLLEDAVQDFPAEVYYPDLFQIRVKPVSGEEYQAEVKVHHPKQSALRKCDELLPLFVEKKAAFQSKIALADTWVFDAEKMVNTMLEAYYEHGITMYSPVKK